MRSHRWSRQDWWGCGWGGGHFALIAWRVWPTHWVWNAVWPQVPLFYTPSVALWASVRHQMIQRLVGRFSFQTTECWNRPNYHRSCVGVTVLSLSPSHFCLAGPSEVHLSLSHFGWAHPCVCLLHRLLCWYKWIVFPIIMRSLFSFCVLMPNSFCVLFQVLFSCFLKKKTNYCILIQSKLFASCHAD